MKYIGDKEIEKIEDNVVYFKTEEGKTDSEEFSKDLLERIVTDEPIDASEMRDKRCFGIAEEILAVLLRNNIYLGELEYVFQRVIWSITENRNKAEDKLWGVEEGKKTVKQLDEILKK